MRIRPLLLSLAVAAAALSCGGSKETPTSPPPPSNEPVVTTVGVQIPLAQLEVTSTEVLTADVRDQTGTPLAGKTATWKSFSTEIATIDASGILTGVSLGTATITATVDGRIGSVTVTIIPLRVASVAITPPTAPIFPGQAVPMAATLADRNGAVLTGRTIVWKSSDTHVATIDAAGTLNAQNGGTTTITATSEAVSGSLTVVVSPPAGTTVPTITGIAPAVLRPGAAATITGADFIPSPLGTLVSVAGVSATVMAATTTQLTVLLPAAGLPCLGGQSATVSVSTIAGTGTFAQPLNTATPRTLAVGASFMATAGPTLGCNELLAGGTYVVSVFNAGTVLTANASFELRGGAGGSAVAALVPSDVLRATRIVAAPIRSRTPIDPAVAAAAHEHLLRLEHDLALIRELGPARNYRSAPRTGATPGLSPASPSFALAPVPLSVGQTATVNFNYNGCSAGVSPVITARVVYVGPKAIVLEDNAGPLAGKIDADMIALAQEFETVSFPLLLNFGDPLAYDAHTDANGRIIMMFTPKVNQAAANILGFVQSCDLYPPTAATNVSASNQAEIFYARAVTDTSSTSTSLNGRPQWRRNMPSTIIHESKHIVAFAERMADPRPTVSEAVWLEEGTAQVASELYGRAIHANGWRSNAGYDGTLDCEIRPGVAGCGRGNFVMGNHFLFLADYLQGFEAKSILSGTDDNDIYGSAWMFVRWLTDTYGGADEGAFLRSIVKSVNTSGTINVTTPSGRSWAELLSQFTLMLAADELSAVTSPYIEPSWNLPAVYVGYNRDLASPPPAVPLTLRQATFGSVFAATATPLRGGGAMLLQLTGAAGATSQVLDLHATSGAALPGTTNLGIAVLRIR
ncbi:MAG: Ig-like domain-containing protein [bacterium]